MYLQGCTKGQKSGGAGSNAGRRRCPAEPFDLPKSGGAAAPHAPPLGASLDNEKTPGQKGGNKKRTIILSASQQTFGPSCFNRA